jgi:cobalamin-dependent methionine synthase I
MVTIVGNRLNSSNKKVLDRMNKMDFEFVKRETLAQIQQGADVIELNAVSLLHNEIKFLKKAVPLMEELGARIMLVSENVDALQQVLALSKNEIIVGEIEYDVEKIDYLLAAIKEKKAKMIAQIRSKNDDQSYSPEKSLLVAQQYIDYLLDHGIKREDILLDPVVRPLEVDFSHGKTFLNTLELFKLDFPQVKTMANISNLSEGLPKRHLIASYFVSLALSKGLDYVVTNVVDDGICESIITTQSIIGKDRNLQSYLRYCRNHKQVKIKE